MGLYLRFYLFLGVIVLPVHLSAQGSFDEELMLNQWVVKIAPGTSVKSLVKELGADEFRQLKFGQSEEYYLLKYTSKSANSLDVEKRLKQNHHIKWSQRDRITKIVKKSPTDPLVSDQWHLNNISGVNAFEAWDLGYTGEGVQICIIDDGIQISHPDISSKYHPNLSWDFNSNEPDPTGTSSDPHGTACAGVAAASGEDGSCGVGAAHGAGLSGLRLIAAGVSAITEAEALSFRIDSNFIYSNSWGPTDNGLYHGSIPIQEAAMEEAVTTGRNGLGNIYTWAAGNGGSIDNTNYDPYVNSIYTIGVGAHGNDGVFSSYSEPGASMLISAPSNGGSLGITTSDLLGVPGYSDGDCTNSFGGTSSACPLAAGVIALMLEANPMLDWRDVQNLLVRNAQKIDPNHPDWTINGAGYNINHNYGFGAIDAEILVQAAMDWDFSVGPSIEESEILTSIDQSIPDNIENGLSKIISVNTSDILSIEHVELVVDVDHTRASDLQIELISPKGTSSVLAKQRNVGMQSFQQTTFMTVRNWGESALGDWEVKISDRRSGSTGQLNGLTLILHGTSDCSTPAIIDISEDIEIASGLDTFLYVSANVAEPAEYKWMKDGAILNGATDDTLYLSNVSLEDYGVFQVEVLDTCRSLMSELISLSPPCETEVTITIIPDDYGSETTWNITNGSGDILISGGPYENSNTEPIVVTTHLCGACFRFTIFDSVGDGICCDFGDGSYSIAYLDTLIETDSNNPFNSIESVEICICESDTDMDGTVDCEDECPYDATKVMAGVCGCGVSDQALVLDDSPIASGVYSTTGNISMSGQIPFGFNVRLQTPQEVLIEENSEVELGGLLEVQTGDCN